MNLRTIVGHVGGRCKGEAPEQKAWENAPVGSSEIKASIRRSVDDILALLDKPRDRRSFDQVERALRAAIFAVARLCLAFFLARREEESEKDIRKWLRRGYSRRSDLRRKHLGTTFGRVTFWRTYMAPGKGPGLFPLDRSLELTRDGFSFLLLGACARLSTLLTYEQVTGIFLYFLSSSSPSKTTVENAVLGFGRHAADWFEAAPRPEGDGEILVIQIDSKATPTATDQELEKRRGPRPKDEQAPSARHRGRKKRQRRGSKKRRKKGDKSKNGKCATIVVMYTLKKDFDGNGKAVLLGPINKFVYASYAPKRHAFAIARREARKRGFTNKSGKRIHIITDGDEDLERNVKEFFPKARHTLDIFHALEYFWEAGRFVFQEGSDELASWVKKQEKLLYRGKAGLAVLHLNELNVPSRHHKRLGEIRRYLSKRIEMMHYDELRKKDLDVASGAVEGAVRHVIAKRLDSSGMRWIRERAEALLQLRCIEINGDWDAFASFVAERMRRDDEEHGDGVARVLTDKPAPLPTYGVAA